MRPLAWMRLIRESDLPHTTRCVAWAVGLRASRDGHCWPSYDRIAKDSGIHRTTAIRQVRVLLESGWLMSAQRGNGHGQQSNSYQLATPVDNSNRMAPEPVDNSQGVVAQDHQVVAHGYPLGGSTPLPEEVLPNEVRQNPPAGLWTTDNGNSHIAAVVNLMTNQHRIPN
jgi:hypothetical protein